MLRVAQFLSVLILTLFLLAPLYVVVSESVLGFRMAISSGDEEATLSKKVWIAVSEIDRASSKHLGSLAMGGLIIYWLAKAGLFQSTFGLISPRGSSRAAHSVETNDTVK
jgi:hypothetical protein